MQAARLISELVHQGRGEAALNYSNKALGLFPDHPVILRTAGEVFMRSGDFAKATQIGQKLTKISPREPGVFLFLCTCQAQAGNEAAAVKSARRAAELAPGNAEVLSNAANMLARLDESEAAAKYYKAALKINPGDAQGYYGLALVQQFLGDLEAAEASCDQALELNPALFEVHWTRSRLRCQSSSLNHVAELERVRTDIRKLPIEQSLVCYSLAKEYEDLEEHAKSFELLEQGAKTYRDNVTYSVEPDLQQMDELIRLFDRATVAASCKGEPNDAPLFVLGLPRTGTTLVERILASHSQVTSAGELPTFMQQRTELVASDVPAAPNRSMVALAMQLDPKKLGSAYLASVPMKYKTTPHFVDKLPANFLNVGFIRRSLPNAKIVEMVRHPMDTCYAMYKTLFQNIYPASYDLDELAQYYIHYRKLMDYWHAVFPGAIIRVSYEDMVADQEAQSRRLLEKCGLAWEDAVLDFQKTKSASGTASAAQVRQPIYTSSVQRWRRYEKQLAPLAKRLIAAGIDIS